MPSDILIYLWLGLSLCIGAAVAWMAHGKGRQPLPWFLYGMILPPLAAFHIAVAPKRYGEYDDYDWGSAMNEDADQHCPEQPEDADAAGAAIAARATAEGNPIDGDSLNDVTSVEGPRLFGDPTSRHEASVGNERPVEDLPRGHFVRSWDNAFSQVVGERIRPQRLYRPPELHHMPESPRAPESHRAAALRRASEPQQTRAPEPAPKPEHVPEPRSAPEHVAEPYMPESHRAREARVPEPHHARQRVRYPLGAEPLDTVDTDSGGSSEERPRLLLSATWRSIPETPPSRSFRWPRPAVTAAAAIIASLLVLTPLVLESMRSTGDMKPLSPEPTPPPVALSPLPPSSQESGEQLAARSETEGRSGEQSQGTSDAPKDDGPATTPAVAPVENAAPSESAMLKKSAQSTDTAADKTAKAAPEHAAPKTATRKAPPPKIARPRDTPTDFATTIQKELRTHKDRMVANDAQGDTITATGEIVRLVQMRLRERGYDPGVVDGRAGAKTRMAIRAFERDHRLPQRGTVDLALLQRLGIAGKEIRAFRTLSPVAEFRSIGQ